MSQVLETPKDAKLPEIATISKIAIAQWMLERQLAWISAADAKVGVVVTIDLALMGGLAAAFSGATLKNLPGELFAALAGIALTVAIACAAAATFPRLKGPKASFLYFGRVAELDENLYTTSLNNATQEELIEDWVRQIHTNARIANIKHSCVRRAMIWSFSAIPFWLIALGYFVKT